MWQITHVRLSRPVSLSRLVDLMLTILPVSLGHFILSTSLILTFYSYLKNDPFHQDFSVCGYPFADRILYFLLTFIWLPFSFKISCSFSLLFYTWSNTNFCLIHKSFGGSWNLKVLLFLSYILFTYIFKFFQRILKI